MEWSDCGIVLSARVHGESSAILMALTRDHGRHPGLVRGGAGRKQRAILQPGSRLQLTWRARLAEHLGNYVCEPDGSVAAGLIDDPARLMGLTSALALAESALPEREPHPAIFEGLGILLDSLAGDDWLSVLVKWEIGLLGDLGFGLDLARCAATGRNDQLAYVSPRSARAVCLAAGEPYRERLLALPPFLLVPGGRGDLAEVCDGLVLTGYFLERHVLGALHRGLPPARQRLAAWIRERCS